MASLVKRKKATASTTTSSKAPASTASLASSIRPIWAPPKNSLNSFSKRLPPFLSPPHCETSVWAAEQVVAGYAGLQQVERVFGGLKDGEWLARGPMHHWTDRKIRIHAFYCMLGISVLQYVHRQAKAAWNDLSMDQLIEELQQIQQFILLYPRQGEKGPARAVYVLSKQTLAQQAFAKALKLDELQITHRG
jgi:transposase